MGVYKIPCSKCHLQYFGMTGRSLQQRLSEHKTYVKKALTTSAIFLHLRDKKHHMDWPAARIIYPSTNLETRLLVEKSLIATSPNINIAKASDKTQHKLSSTMANSISCKVKDVSHPHHVPPD